jgi:hypothetical protein
LRIVKSRERGSAADILSRPESVLDTNAYVTPSLPLPRYGPSERAEQVTRQELAQMAPIDRRGASGTRGTNAADASVVIVDGKKRVKGALWLSEQMRRIRKHEK